MTAEEQLRALLREKQGLWCDDPIPGQPYPDYACGKCWTCRVRAVLAESGVDSQPTAKSSKKRVILDDDTLAGLTGEFEGMRNAFQRNMPTARMVPIEIKDAINVAHALEELRNRRAADETKAEPLNLRLPMQGRYWPDSLFSLLSQIATMLDVVKSQDWTECWSEYDQAQRDAITAYMLAIAPAGAGSGSCAGTPAPAPQGPERVAQKTRAPQTVEIDKLPCDHCGKPMDEHLQPGMLCP